MSTAIWWIRRDLRLADNLALTSALESATQVIPLFIIDPKLVNSRNRSPKRLAFLWNGLRALDADLRKRGSRLIIRKGSPEEILARSFEKFNSQLVFAEADYTPYARQRDQRVSKMISLRLVGSPSLSHPESILKADNTPYIVFTPFMRAWTAAHNLINLVPIPTPTHIRTPDEIESDPIPNHDPLYNNGLFPPGGNKAHSRLKMFTNGDDPPIYHYAEDRNRMDLDGTSQLSPYLRFGMLTSKQALAVANNAINDAPDRESKKGAQTWLNELIWREFYISILYHFPNVLQESFRSNYQYIKWSNNTQDFNDWCYGRTGYPIVDAAMRQLFDSGWMHNRARMIVASFLVKDLLIDWRWGEKWFMQNLIDGDPASNNGGWQWTAGTGTDAAPYFRIFNPILQSNKFDPSGTYIRKWIPELYRVPAKYIHSPWEMPIELQSQIGCLIGHDYPPPIIDHQYAKDRTLAAYKAAKET